MRKSLIILFIFSLFITSALVAGPVENLYTLIVPQTSSRLFFNGGLGSPVISDKIDDVVEINMGFDPFDLSIATGVQATYVYGKQTLDDSLAIDTVANLTLSDTLSNLYFEGTGSYKSYTLNLQEYLGFYDFSLHARLNTNLSSNTVTTVLDLDPKGAIGIGRSYSITTLKQIELMFKYLAIPLTEQTIRTAAEFLYTRENRLSRYSDDNRLNFTTYYRDLAQALNVPDKVLNLIYIDQSQEFAFERARFDDLRYGWEAQLAIEPKFHLETGSSYSKTDVILSGEYAAFFMENRLHCQANGSIGVAYSSQGSQGFSFRTTLGGRARYLPQNYHWWVDSGMQVVFDTTDSPKFHMQLNGELNYMLTPNFVTYAGLEVYNTFKDYMLYAGGRYRIW
ncbi:hypothetical protein SpiGrapes_1168 [Sphaerochaeta pleomorpha str. Grapes]|uniref:Uncharacterized protein n=1 Tax=Sphaerochaeta pleomorpha (strain ATCC BAA-1885 / DSM 22778 / Grapes) TaxID=158190 RepID=G8QSM4_SPHPG|nr:hypothetical protein [Sphaerochaeta pleomorpha]AEV28985.1 hypothetical protein SpiGrapes_1168 [Sphaerochaeta pleomorpha str. Grapes]